MTSPIGTEWTSLVEFLETRVAEQESAIREGAFAGATAEGPASDDKVSLEQLMLDECAQKRAFIASWKEAADAEGITDPSHATGTTAIARRSMLTILPGSYQEHADYDPAWSRALPTGMPGEAATN
jgi:hypothetical protein